MHYYVLSAGNPRLQARRKELKWLSNRFGLFSRICLSALRFRLLHLERRWRTTFKYSGAANL